MPEVWDRLGISLDAPSDPIAFYHSFDLRDAYMAGVAARFPAATPAI